VPHAWIGAEFVLAVLGLFAYESADDSLVLAAGISAAWLDAGGWHRRSPDLVGTARLHDAETPGNAIELDLSPGLRRPGAL
jgi:hypothetical protein